MWKSAKKKRKKAKEIKEKRKEMREAKTRHEYFLVSSRFHFSVFSLLSLLGLSHHRRGKPPSVTFSIPLEKGKPMNGSKMAAVCLQTNKQTNKQTRTPSA